jgi:CDP-paratose synthetase
MSSPGRILLTGTTGFLGSRLAASLSGSGHELILIKRRTSDVRRTAPLPPGTTMYDVEDLDLSALFKRHGRIDAVIHAATCYARGKEGVAQVFETNTAFPLRLLEAAATHGAGVFFNSDTILPGNISLYALSKRHFLDWGKAFASDKRIRFVNVRLEHMYGPGDADWKFTTNVIKSCLRNVSSLDLTPGDQKRDFVYIDDAVDAFLRIWEHERALPPGYMGYDVGSGEAVSIRDFVTLVKTITRSSTRMNFGALPYRENELMECRLDVDPLKRLGWRPRTGLARGVEMVARELERTSVAG